MSDAPCIDAGPALGLIELSSLARAFRVSDALIKKAPSRILLATPISPGNFLILFHGGVAEVEESYEAGIVAADTALKDSVFLPYCEEQILAHLKNSLSRPVVDALGIVETDSCAATIRAADAALKAAETALVYMHLGKGIGGKGIFAFTGELCDVQASLEVAELQAPYERVLMKEEIAAPHGAMTLELLGLGSVAPDY